MASQRKLPLIVVIVTSVLLLTAAALLLDLHKASEREVVSRSHAHQTMMVRQLAQEIQQYLRARSQGTQVLSTFASVQHRDMKKMVADIQDYFQYVKKSHVKAISVYDEKGTIIYSTTKDAIGRNYAECDFFQWAARKENRGKQFVAALPEEKQNQVPKVHNLVEGSIPTERAPHSHFLVATPVYREARDLGYPRPTHKFVGVLTYTIDLEEVIGAFLPVVGPGLTKRQVWILDTSGTVLFQSEHPEMILRNIRRADKTCMKCHVSFDYVQEVLAQKQGTIEYTIRDQPKKFAWYAPLAFENVSWIIAVSASLDEVSGFLNRQVAETFLLIGVIAIVLVAALVLIYRSNRLKIRAEEEAKQWREKRELEDRIRASEERYRRLVEISPDAIAVHCEGKIVFVNQAGVRLLGATSPEELLGKPALDLVHPDDRETVRERIAATLEDGKVVPVVEERFLRLDGAVIDVEVAAAPTTHEGKPAVQVVVRDITERKQSQQALQDSERKYRSLVDNALVGVYRTNLTGDVLYVNDTVARMGGFASAEEVERFGVLQRYKNPRDREKLIETLRKTGRVQDFEVELLTSSGETRSALVSATLEGEEISGMVLDITERKRAEEARRQSEERFRLLAESSLAGIYIIQDQKFAYVNQSIASTFGYTVDEIVDRLGPLDLTHPDDRPIVVENIRRRVQGEVREVHYDFRGVRKDGSIIHVEVHGSRIEYKGKPAVIGTLVDITERTRAEEALRQSELRYRTVVANAPVVLWALDREGKFIFSEGKGLERLGLKPGEVVGQSVSEVYRDVPEIVDNNRQALEGKTITSIIEVGGLSFESHYSPMYGDRGEVIGAIGLAIDITERRQAEEKVAMLAHALRSISECVSITDMEDVLVFVNEAFLKTYGYAEEELLGKHIGIVRSPNNPPEIVHEILPATLRGGWCGELLNRRKDGSEFPISLSTSVVRDDKGQPVALIGVARDITERKRAEEALRESEEKFRSLAEFSPNMIFINKGGRVVYANKMCEAMMGYSRKEFYSPDFDFMSLIAPESRQAVMESYKRHLNGEEIPPYEYTLITKEGKRLIGIHNTKLINYAGSAAILGIVTDITERKRAEERLAAERNLLRTLIDNLPDLIFVKDANGKFIAVNKAVTALFGAKSEEDVIGKTDFDFFQKELAERYRADEEAVIRTGQPQVAKEEPFVDGKGVPRWMSTTKVPLRDPTGKIVGLVGMNRDLTERKNAEEKLKQSREWLRAVFEASRDGIMVEKDGVIVYANKSCANLYGYDSPEELIDERISIILSDVENEQMLGYGRKRIGRGPVPLRYEFKGRRKDGTWIDLEASLSALTIDKDSYIISLVRDITERKQAEAALKESEARFRALAETTASSILIYQGGKIRYANPAAEALTGYSLVELLRLNILDIAHPDFRDLLQQRGLAQEHGEVLPTRCEFKIMRKNHEERWIDFTAGLITFDGKPAGLGTAFDITERKKVEEALRLSDNILQKVGNLVLVGDSSGKITYASPSAKTILGYDPAELLGDGWWLRSRSDPEERRREKQMVARVAAGRMPVREAPYEREIKHRDGSSRWILWQDSKGPEGLLIGVGHDITERKKLEQQLLQAQKLEGLGTLAGGIAHDFNNILGIIVGYASLLEGDKTDPARVARSTSAISKAAQRGSGLVRQLLTFARKTDVQFQSVRVNDVIEELGKLLEETFPKTIEVSVSLDRSIPPIIGDPNQLHQALLNVCINARDAMLDARKPGMPGGKLVLGTGAVLGSELRERIPNAREDNYVCVTVSDTGVGMDEATRSRIFEPFFTTKEPGRGTGLGLSVVYGIIETHHGFIEVDSELNRGTTFRLYLPVPPREVDSSKVVSEDVGGVPAGAETILIVEDEEMLLELLRTLLESKGYKTLTATDGVSAVATYRDHHDDIDLVVMDVGLPGIEGREVLAHLQQINRGVRVIFASGYVDPKVKSELYKAGAKLFIQKPYVPAEVLRCIREVLDRARA